MEKVDQSSQGVTGDKNLLILRKNYIIPKGIRIDEVHIVCVTFIMTENQYACSPTMGFENLSICESAVEYWRREAANMRKKWSPDTE